MSLVSKKDIVQNLSVHIPIGTSLCSRMLLFRRVGGTLSSHSNKLESPCTGLEPMQSKIEQKLVRKIVKYLEKKQISGEEFEQQIGSRDLDLSSYQTSLGNSDSMLEYLMEKRKKLVLQWEMYSGRLENALQAWSCFNILHTSYHFDGVILSTGPKEGFCGQVHPTLL
jgi:hypothetical protein